MPITRRTALAALAGLAPLAAIPLPARAAGPLRLEEALRGTLVGDGLFESRIAGVSRAFRVTMHGTWDARARQFTLAEDFAFADGERDRLTWRFQQTGPGRWSGTREDVVSPAEVVEEGERIRLRYTADYRSRGTVTRLDFDDVLYRGPGGVIINEAVVSRFLLPIGTVRLELRRKAPARSRPAVT